MPRIEHHHTVDVHIHNDEDPRLDNIVELLKAMKRQIGREMAAIDDLTAAVAADATVDASAITLLTELKTMLDEAIASGDPGALQALSDQLGANQAALAAAVSANTPAGEEPPA